MKVSKYVIQSPSAGWFATGGRSFSKKPELAVLYNSREKAEKKVATCASSERKRAASRAETGMPYIPEVWQDVEVVEVIVNFSPNIA